MTDKKIFVMQAFILGTFLALPATRVLAAPGEMGNGFGRDGERPPMTVEGCVEKTGKTTAECQTLMNSFQERVRTRSTEGESKADLRQDDGRAVGSEGRSGRFGMDSTNRFVAIRTRLEKVTAFLKSKGADTTTLESDYAILKEKMTVADSDFTKLRDARTVWQADRSAANQSALDAARTTAKASSDAVKTYYHDTLLPILKTLLQSIA